MFQLGALHWAGLQATDVATTGSPASPNLILVPRVPSFLLPMLMTEPQLPQLLSILPPGSFAPRAVILVLRLWNWASAGSQQLVCYQPAPAEIPADSQHSMEAHGTAKATLSPVKPMALSLHPWSQLPAL